MLSALSVPEKLLSNLCPSNLLDPKIYKPDCSACLYPSLALVSGCLQLYYFAPKAPQAYPQQIQLGWIQQSPYSRMEFVPPQPLYTTNQLTFTSISE